MMHVDYPSRRAVVRGLFGGCIGVPLVWIEQAPAQDVTQNTAAQQHNAMTPSEQLLHATVQIVCETSPGNLSFGTGFFFALFRQGDQNVPVIVTNKHVIAGSRVGHFRLTAQKDDGAADLKNFIDVTLPDFPAQWIPHPDPAVDLAIMPCAGLLQQLRSQGKTPFLVTLDSSVVPTEQELADLTPLEDGRLSKWNRRQGAQYTGISPGHHSYACLRRLR